MIGSLDYSHFVWGNCPVAHHGQFQGKEGKPTIVMEAMCDYNLFAWHTMFGYSGVLMTLTFGILACFIKHFVMVLFYVQFFL
jgi:hypothetical protein